MLPSRDPAQDEALTALLLRVEAMTDMLVRERCQGSCWHGKSISTHLKEQFLPVIGTNSKVADSEMRFIHHIILKCLNVVVYTLDMVGESMAAELFFDITVGVAEVARLALPAKMCRRLRRACVHFVHSYGCMADREVSLQTSETKSSDNSYLQNLEGCARVVRTMSDIPHDVDSYNLPTCQLELECCCRLCVETIRASVAHRPSQLSERQANGTTFMHMLVASIKSQPKYRVLLAVLCSSHHQNIDWNKRDDCGMLIENYTRDVATRLELRHIRATSRRS